MLSGFEGAWGVISTLLAQIWYGLALVRCGCRWLPFLCLGVSAREWSSSALKGGLWTLFLKSVRWLSDLLFVLCLPPPSDLLVVVIKFYIGAWSPSISGSPRLFSFTEMACLGVSPSQCHGGQLIALSASSCISVSESEVALAPLWINNNPKGEHNVRLGVALATCLCCLTILQLNRCCRTILLESLLSTAVYPRIRPGFAGQPAPHDPPTRGSFLSF
ncbi:hypothetical protein DY000_02023014 [Brassica cretica]|uniref:Uncharacterized protein n=1 Tax=Brassica cretica TaxID=69181 RepID=A0ABQ7E4F8_BRACR|nr:hypothetical protein DY000_02023014 [Brassica cretica]